MQRVANFAYNDDAPPPVEILEAAMWERFHCLPSELDTEDAARLLVAVGALDLYRTLKKMQRGNEELTPGEYDMIGKALEADLELG